MALLSIVMGCNEAEFLGEGWLEREAPPQSPVYRATGERASLNLSAGEAARVSILMRAHPARPDIPFTGQFVISYKEKANGVALSGEHNKGIPFELRFPEWCLREFILPESAVPRRLTIICDRTWRPSDLFANHDPRILGVLVASVSCQPFAGQQD